MNTKYLIEHKLFKKPVSICYNEFGILCFYDGTGLDQKQSDWFLNNLPLTENIIPVYQQKYSNSLRISKAQSDISFEAAYNAYNFKVGKKEKSRKLWNNMLDNDKHLFFRMLADYNAYLTKKHIAKAYFETFLNNQYYLNDYKSQLL